MKTHDEVAKAAYELWEKSGRTDGRDRDNWFDAELIVAERQKEQPKVQNKIKAGKIGGPGKKESIVPEKKRSLKSK